LTVEEAYYEEHLGEEIANMHPQVHLLGQGYAQIIVVFSFTFPKLHIFHETSEMKVEIRFNCKA